MDRVIVETPDRKRFSIDRELVADRWPGSRIISWEDGRPYAGPQPSQDVVEDEAIDDFAPLETDEAALANIFVGGWVEVPPDEIKATESDGDQVRHGRPSKRPSEDRGAAPDGGAEAPQEDR